MCFFFCRAILNVQEHDEVSNMNFRDLVNNDMGLIFKVLGSKFTKWQLFSQGSRSVTLLVFGMVQLTSLINGMLWKRLLLFF